MPGDPDSNTHTIHVFAALCDNKYQGIIPVPAVMGNGQDPDNNLYWGWGLGIRTYFNKSREWKLIRKTKPAYPLLERLVYRHHSGNYYLVADAYDGRAMKDCLDHFLLGVSGKNKETIRVDSVTIGLGGHAKLLAFVGHNGLMDLSLPSSYPNNDKRKRDCMILACFSKRYFSPYIKQAGANPLLWTSNLFGPEAYTLHDALSAYIKGENTATIQTKAAAIYAKYTKCSVQAAKKLLVTGW
ncbi:MAG: hypothetical protein HZA79_03850 [Sphingobacteriales bacterium]|nr:hypothetical protein [Sphingobacteriales bacterium]